jgi:hypothetical protein
MVNGSRFAMLCLIAPDGSHEVRLSYGNIAQQNIDNCFNISSSCSGSFMTVRLAEVQVRSRQKFHDLARCASLVPRLSVDEI